MKAISSRKLRSRCYVLRLTAAHTSPSQSGEVRERTTAGAFGADFGDHNPVALMDEILEDILQLRRGMGAVQRPLIGQHGAGFEGAQPQMQRSVVGVLQQVARYQVEFE